MNIAIYIYYHRNNILWIYIYIYRYISGNPTGKDPKVNATDTVIYSYLFGLLYIYIYYIYIYIFIIIYIDTHIMVVCISYFPNMDITRDRMGYCQWTSYGCSFNNETSRNHLGFLRMHIELWYLDNGRSMDIPWECERRMPTWRLSPCRPCRRNCRVPTVIHDKYHFPSCIQISHCQVWFSEPSGVIKHSWKIHHLVQWFSHFSMPIEPLQYHET